MENDISDYAVVEIHQQPIELCKLLKIANLVGGGGEAKIVISEGYVLLNGEVEFQKRKKVYEHDIIEFNGEMIQVALAEQTRDFSKAKKDQKTSDSKPAKELKKKKKEKNNNKGNRDNNSEHKANSTIRKPINF